MLTLSSRANIILIDGNQSPSIHLNVDRHRRTYYVRLLRNSLAPRNLTETTVMPPPSPPSPMALSKHSQAASIFKKRATSSASAASYLSALSQADASARARTGIAQSFTTTPALSISSSITSLEDTSLDATENASEALIFPVRPPTSVQSFTTRHTEFGHCAEPTFRTTSFHPLGTPLPPSLEQDPPYYILFSTYISYLILIVIGHIRDFVGKRVYPASYRDLMPRNVS